MPITVLVRSATGNEARLTFDGMQRVVIGRGSSCDVRLPDPSVSHRHASLQTKGAEFVVVDEGSTNGTFVGGVRVAPRTSRLVRGGDLVRVGRVWLELRVEQTPLTRDVAAATREIALALVGDALAQLGADPTMRLRVVEGRDQGATLVLTEVERAYVVGRGAECDLPLADGDASREHAHVTRRASVVVVRDLGAKNGTWLGESRVEPHGEAVWKPAQMMQIGRTVLALEEPLGDALARIESAPDEAMPPDEIVAEPPKSAARPGSAPAAAPAGDAPAPPSAVLPPPASAGIAAPVPSSSATRARRRRAGWNAADFLVIAAALAVLGLSIAGLVWLLRG
jgi:pSer/pThr/pTyr-binding forkhead associated (FHA) protein